MLISLKIEPRAELQLENETVQRHATTKIRKTRSKNSIISEDNKLISGKIDILNYTCPVVLRTNL